MDWLEGKASAAETPPAEEIPNEEGLILEPLDVTHAAEARAKKPVSQRRPRGTASRKQKVDRKQFTNQIVGVHKLLAALTKQPIVAVTEAEGEALACACADIIEEYGLAMSRRALLWCNLISAVAIVYGPRVAMAMAVAKNKRQENKPLKNAPPPGGPMATPKMDFSAL